MVVQSKLELELETLFIAPFASHPWASDRGRGHWVELEGWQDSIAGPLCSIVKHGGCEYVYSQDDEFLSGVNDPSQLRMWLLKRHLGLATGVERFTPTTPDETTDLAFMRSIVARMLELVELACVIERMRWEAARKTEPGSAT